MTFSTAGAAALTLSYCLRQCAEAFLSVSICPRISLSWASAAAGSPTGAPSPAPAAETPAQAPPPIAQAPAVPPPMPHPNARPFSGGTRCGGSAHRVLAATSASLCWRAVEAARAACTSARSCASSAPTAPLAPAASSSRISAVCGGGGGGMPFPAAGGAPRLASYSARHLSHAPSTTPSRASSRATSARAAPAAAACSSICVRSSRSASATAQPFTQQRLARRRELRHQLSLSRRCGCGHLRAQGVFDCSSSSICRNKGLRVGGVVLFRGVGGRATDDRGQGARVLVGQSAEYLDLHLQPLHLTRRGAGLADGGGGAGGEARVRAEYVVQPRGALLVDREGGLHSLGQPAQLDLSLVGAVALRPQLGFRLVVQGVHLSA
eukprot:scaffold12246_cov112-Isochrysis_galbana.AAC.7